MSAAYINRSLTTIRTELEFLADLEVITPDLLEKILLSIPQKYQKDQAPWGVERLGGSTNNGADKLADELQNTHIESKPKPVDAYAPPSYPPVSSSASITTSSSRPPASKPLGYCKALFDYNLQENDDLNLSKGDKLIILEHLSEDWWKGYKKGQSPSSAGVFPSNYVQLIPESDFDSETKSFSNEKAQYNALNENYGPAPPQYGQQQQQYQQLPPQQQNYAPFPPPSTNYYQQQPQQMQVQQPQPQQMQVQQPQPQQMQVQQPQPQQQEQGSSHPHLKKFGSKLGNAAIFGAGATIGSDIVNSIF